MKAANNPPVGLPIRWHNEVTAWEPPHRFVDERCSGPYRVWIHEHTFAECEGGTLVDDHVRYAIPGGWLADRLFVGCSVAQIFAYRQKKLSEFFA